MTFLGKKGARVFLAPTILVTGILTGSSASLLCPGIVLAADPLVPEVQDIPPTPPTAALPGADPLGTPSAPVMNATPPPAAATPQKSTTEETPPPVPPAASVEDSPSVGSDTQQNPVPGASPKVDDVVVTVKQDEPDWPNINKKRYLEYHSHWAFQMDISPAALGRNLGLGGNDSNGNPVNAQPWGVGLAFEYEPEWFHRFGVLSFGPSLNLYPAFSSNDDFPNAEAIWSVGAQIKYQARFKEQQFIVPFVGLNFEKVSYHLVTEGTGSLDITGPVLGVNILLNALDPINATAFYFDAGVLKTYLVLEGRLLEGDNGVLDVSGLSWFFGVRMEF